MKDGLNLSSKDDISKELKQNRIEKDNSDLLKLIDTVKGTMNPFDFNLDKNTLYNIGTGKGASTETSDFLLNYKKIGKSAKEQFIQEVISSPECFEQPTKCQKVRTFASDLGEKKLTSKDNKIKAVTMMKDLFGSILCMSIERDIDLKVIFSYPLIPVPLSLGHLDGTIHKTPKAALLDHLEKFAVSEKPNKISATIVDAMFYLRLQTNLPEIFGGVSRHIFKALCQMSGEEIHFIFDKTVCPSIKDIQRTSRERNDTLTYIITRPFQKRPTDWLKAMKIDSFKKSLVQYLTESWKNHDLATYLGNKTLYANSANKVYAYKVEDSKLIVAEEDRLYSDHEGS